MADWFDAHKWPLLAAAAVSGLGVFPLMGLPGAGLMELLDRVANWLHGRPLGAPMQYGDAHWPIAICYSIAAPWLLFGIHWGLRTLGATGWLHAAAVAAIGLVTIAGVHALWVSPAASARAAERTAYEASPQARLRDLKQALMRLAESDNDYYLANLQGREPGKRTPGSELAEVLGQVEGSSAGPQLDAERLASLHALSALLRSIDGNPSLQQQHAIRTSPEWIEVRRRSKELAGSVVP